MPDSTNAVSLNMCSHGVSAEASPTYEHPINAAAAIAIAVILFIFSTPSLKDIGDHFDNFYRGNANNQEDKHSDEC
ncbi:hypothetical protein ACYTX7_09725, partial [Streptococcus pyogenes]